MKNVELVPLEEIKAYCNTFKGGFTQDDFFARAYVNFPKETVQIWGRVISLSDAKELIETLN